MSAWKTIESAPLDGTEVDLWYPMSGGRGVRHPECKFYKGRWCFLWEDSLTPVYGSPTHWMPIPNGPNKE